MKRIITVFLIFIMSFLSGCSKTYIPANGPTNRQINEPTKEYTSPGTTYAGKETGQQMQNVVPVKVVSVIDGDTFKVNLNGKKEKIRPIGINAPELNHPELGIKEQPYGKETLRYAENKLHNREVYLTFDVTNRDKYGRILAYVWLEKPVTDNESEIRSKMFNAIILKDGYAQVMTVPPNVKYSNIFVKIEREARGSKKGLWAVSGEKPNDRYGK